MGLFISFNGILLQNIAWHKSKAKSFFSLDFFFFYHLRVIVSSKVFALSKCRLYVLMWLFLSVYQFVTFFSQSMIFRLLYTGLLYYQIHVLPDTLLSLSGLYDFYFNLFLGTFFLNYRFNFWKWLFLLKLYIVK